MHQLEQFTTAYQEYLNDRELYSLRLGIKPYRLLSDPQTEDIIGKATTDTERLLNRKFLQGNELALSSAVANTLAQYTTRGKYNHGRIISGGDFSLGKLLNDASCIERAVFTREIFDGFGVSSNIKMTWLLGIPFHHFVHVPDTDEVIDLIVPLMLRDCKHRSGYFSSESEYLEKVSTLNNISTIPEIIHHIGKV